MKKNLYIFGTGEYARKVFYTSILANFNVIAFIDENIYAHSPIADIPVLQISSTSIINENLLFIAIGDSHVRKRLLETCKNQGWEIVNIIHPSSCISPNVHLKCGIFIGAGVIVESNTHINDGAIIDIGSIIDHDCSISAYTHLRAGQVCQPRTHWK